jgi:hypothetical protein
MEMIETIGVRVETIRVETIRVETIGAMEMIETIGAMEMIETIGVRVETIRVETIRVETIGVRVETSIVEEESIVHDKGKKGGNVLYYIH